MQSRSALERYIYDSGMTKETVIKRSRINRTTFYMGLKYPLVFTDMQRKRISKALKMDLVSFESLISQS